MKLNIELLYNSNIFMLGVFISFSVHLVMFFICFVNVFRWGYLFSYLFFVIALFVCFSPF